MSTQDDSLTLHTDLYQINMIYTYWQTGIHNTPVIFESYFRNYPFKNGYTIFSGLSHIIDYLKNIRFSQTDIDYLRSLNLYSEDFLIFLSNWQLSATIRSPYEGEVMFAHEPLIQVEGPLIDGQLLETALLNIINYQTLVATKASRIVDIVNGNPLLEFGTRRAQELDAALWGTRAAYIAGFDATSNVRAGKLFHIPVSGTHAHALVQAFKNDYEAFTAYAKTHKDVVFLIDTFDTLNSGIVNAIKVAQEFGSKINFKGVRIDSGDMVRLSKRIRLKLDEAGFPDAKIYASNDLDEYAIASLKHKGAAIDVWGVGTKLITAYDQPALGAVYKMVRIANENTIKLSDDIEKISTPGKKQIWRNNGQDIVGLSHENYSGEKLLHDIFVNGDLTYQEPSTEQVRDYKKMSLSKISDNYKKLEVTDHYPVILSDSLKEQKVNIINQVKNHIKEN